MKILVDADACPVKEIIANVAEEFGVRTIFIFSTSHYSRTTKYQTVEKIMVDNESQAADMAIMNKVSAGDIVITGDFGLAALVLGKKAFALSFSGRFFDEHNIDKLLFERHLSGMIRRSGGRVKGPGKRNTGDDMQFEHGLRTLILKNLKDI